MENKVLDAAVVELEGLRKRLEFAAGYHVQAYRLTNDLDDLARADELDGLMKEVRRLTIEYTESIEQLEALINRAS
ncbi:hypothetical protein [Endozoicomonas montiporae]|nr:hypothetical protein [Endozoicomonas montiporae]AMO57520.1 hypothetical protein EZMO1_3537 [Endozoicomonas montiporae CL-33]